MILRSILLPGVVLPAAVCAAVWLLLGQPWRRHPPHRAMGVWAAALGLGAGYLAAQVALSGWPPLPPAESTHWLFYLITVATLVALAGAHLTLPASALWAIRLALVGSLVGLTLKPMMEYQWQTGEALLWLTGLGSGCAALGIGIESLANRRPGHALSLSLALVAGGSGTVLGLSGSALLGQLAGALAATLGVATVSNWFVATPSLERWSAQVVALILFGLLLNGYFYAELEAVNGLLLALAPLAAWVSQIRPIRQLHPFLGSVVTAACVLLVMAPALILAVAKFLTQEAYDY